MVVERVDQIPYKAVPRVEVRGDSLEEVDAGALVNSAFHITKEHFTDSDAEIISRLQQESQAHHRTTKELTARNVKNLRRRAEQPQCRDYLEVVERTVYLMREAGLLPKESKDVGD